jgi:hypothetical protein
MLMRAAETGAADIYHGRYGIDNNDDNGVRASALGSVGYGSDDTGHGRWPRLSVVIGKPSNERRSRAQLPVFAPMPQDGLHSSQLSATVGGDSRLGKESPRILTISMPDLEEREKIDNILALVSRESGIKRIEGKLALADYVAALLEREGGLRGLEEKLAPAHSVPTSQCDG